MSQTSIKGSVSSFDTYKDQEVYKLTLTNGNGVSISALSYGAILHEILVPDHNGGQANLVLNYAHTADYYENPFYVCMAIGRTGGRIGDGELPLGGKTYTLPANEGPTTLHGGPEGFSSHAWEGRIDTTSGVPVIVFHRNQLSSEDGFPGDMDVEVRYALTEDDQVVISFTAESNALTVFNPTQHTYFNLGNDETIKDHTLKINTTRHMEFDDIKVPTGKLLANEGTPFDFAKGPRLGDAIDGMMDTDEKGFDDIVEVEPDDNKLIATLADPKSGRSVDIHSDRNGLVVFTANSFTKENMKFIRSNGVGTPYEGVALEAQTLSDATKHPGFGDVTLPANEKETKEITFALKY